MSISTSEESTQLCESKLFSNLSIKIEGPGKRRAAMLILEIAVMFMQLFLPFMSTKELDVILGSVRKERTACPRGTRIWYRDSTNSHPT